MNLPHPSPSDMQPVLNQLTVPRGLKQGILTRLESKAEKFSWRLPMTLTLGGTLALAFLAIAPNILPRPSHLPMKAVTTASLEAYADDLEPEALAELALLY